jgi:uncharacterized protein (DUF1800 family)
MVGRLSTRIRFLEIIMMGYRPFLFGVAFAGSAMLPQPVANSAREQTADQQVRHVLSRLAFGARPGDYEKVRQLGVDAWIAQQLAPAKIADPAVTRLIAQLPTYSMSPEELIEKYPRPTPQQQAQRAVAFENARTAADSAAVRRQLQQQDATQGLRAILPELQALRVGRAVVTERQLEEVLVDFWLNHFSVFAGKNAQMRYYLGDYERNVIRPRVFGKFRDMVEAVAKSPAMLIYLDNQQSIADTGRVTLATYGGQPDPGRRRAVIGRGAVVGSQQLPAQRRASGLNENYARELLELHTLGVDGGYTQQDVTEVARALTGWSIVPPQEQGARLAMRTGGVVEGRFMFRSQVHDAEPKTVLGVRLRGGRGIEDGEQVLDIVSAHPSTAKFISRKLAIRFISDKPPQSIVDRAAAVFTKTGGDLREVVRTIITSDEFFSSAAYRAKVKSPFEVVVSALRAVNAPADPTPRTAQFLAQLGQQVFTRQTPDGWPETGDEWINTGSILNRINFGLQLASGRVPGANSAFWPLPEGISRQPKDKQVDAVVAAFLGGEASPETRGILLSGNNPLLNSAVDTTENSMRPPPDTAGVTGLDAMTQRRARAGRAFGPLPPLDGVPLIVGLALGSPEFQRR